MVCAQVPARDHAVHCSWRHRVGMRLLFARRRHERRRGYRHTEIACRCRQNRQRRRGRCGQCAGVALLRSPLSADAAVASRCSTIRRCRRPITSSASPKRYGRASLPPNPAFRCPHRGRRWNSRSRPDRRRHPGAGDAAGARRDRRRPLPPGATARRGGDPADRRRDAPRFYRAVAARRTGGLPRRRRRRGRDRGAARQAPRRDRRHEQARPGARAGLLRRLTAQLASARQRPASERERLVRAHGPVGQRSRFQAAGGACRRCRKRPRALPAVEVEARAPPRRSADRAHRGRGARQVLRADQSDALHQSAGSGRHRPNTTREPGGRTVTERRFRSSSSRCRSSISARCGCGRPSETYMQAVNRLTEKGGRTSARRRATPIEPIARPTTSRATTGASPAAAQDHLRRDAAALQRHADRRVRAAGRSAPAHRRQHRARSRRSAISGSPAPISAPRSSAAA